MTEDVLATPVPASRRRGRRLVCTGLSALIVLALAACGTRDGAMPPAPLDIASNTVCALDGMLLGDYAGPKAQVFYAGGASPEFFCDTVKMFNLYLRPEQVRSVQAIFVQDMGRAEWDRPRGHWIDGQSAWYVVGSRRHGPMGPTIASFAAEADARRFAGEYGGDVLRFSGITLDKVNIDGGALHDSPM